MRAVDVAEAVVEREHDRIRREVVQRRVQVPDDARPEAVELRHEIADREVAFIRTAAADAVVDEHAGAGSPRGVRDPGEHALDHPTR